MIELIFTACLIASPEDCRDVNLSFSDRDASVVTCLMAGQPRIAEWTGDHPSWRVIRYRCAPRREARVYI
jgi:hypothetical protein